jgi:hypothetical protein
MKIKLTPTQLRSYLSTLIPAGVLTWALAVLTMNYIGIATKIDAAFISSLVTSVLAVYGVSRKEEERKEPTVGPAPKIDPISGTPTPRRGRPPGSKSQPKAPPVLPPTP